MLFLERSFQEGRCWPDVGDESTESRSVVQPLLIPMVISPERRTYVVVVRWTDELLCGGYKCVSPFETPCIHLHCWPHVLLSFTSLQEFVGLKIPHSVDRWTLSGDVIKTAFHHVWTEDETRLYGQETVITLFSGCSSHWNEASVISHHRWSL